MPNAKPTTGNFHDPAWEAMEKAIDGLPHHVAKYADDSGKGRYFGELTTADRDNVRTARFMVEKNAEGGVDTSYLRACREVVEAADRREEEVRRLYKEYRMGEYGDRSDQLGDLCYDAEWAVMNEPAPDRPALLWKLEKLLAIEGDGGTAPWTQKAVAQTMADARRLLGDA